MTLGFDPKAILFLPTVIVILSVWDIVWKAMGLWRAARNGQKYWFIAIMVFNTVGILPIIYLKFFRKPRANKTK